MVQKFARFVFTISCLGGVVFSIYWYLNYAYQEKDISTLILIGIGIMFSIETLFYFIASNSKAPLTQRKFAYALSLISIFLVILGGSLLFIYLFFWKCSGENCWGAAIFSAVYLMGYAVYSVVPFIVNTIAAAYFHSAAKQKSR